MSSEQETCALEFGFAEEKDFQQVLNLCSSDDLDGLDYMPVVFHRWLQEPGRFVFVARMNDRVVALGSSLLVDGGQTVILQGLRVAPDLRGRGISKALDKHLCDYIRSHYPQIPVARFGRKYLISTQVLQMSTRHTYRIIAKEAVLPLCCQVADLGPFIAEIRSRLPLQAGCPPGGPVILTKQQAETLIMTDHVVSNLLPSKTIITGWNPLNPVEANLEMLRHMGLTWIVDRESEPNAISLCTAPRAVPLRPDALNVDINIFGNSLVSVCDVFLAQLEVLLLRLQGHLIFHAHVNPAVWPEFCQICQTTSKVSLYRDYCENLVLEKRI